MPATRLVCEASSIRVLRPHELRNEGRRALAFDSRFKVSSRSFGVSTTSGPRLNLLRLEEALSAVHLRLSQVTIECLPWQEYVQRYDRPYTLFFVGLNRPEIPGDSGL